MFHILSARDISIILLLFSKKVGTLSIIKVFLAYNYLQIIVCSSNRLFLSSAGGQDHLGMSVCCSDFSLFGIL